MAWCHNSQATLSHGYLPGLDWRRNRNVKYATIDDAVRLIKSLGKGCFLAKTDIKSAFRIIHVAPSDFPLLGMEWQGKFYSDRCLPMWCSSSCNIFKMIFPQSINLESALSRCSKFCTTCLQKLAPFSSCNPFPS